MIAEEGRKPRSTLRKGAEFYWNQAKIGRKSLKHIDKNASNV
jgi:hypothetical protein